MSFEEMLLEMQELAKIEFDMKARFNINFANGKKYIAKHNNTLTLCIIIMKLKTTKRRMSKYRYPGTLNADFVLPQKLGQ